MYALELHDIDVWNACLKDSENTDAILKEADLSRAMLEGYFEWLEESGADEGLTVIAAEEPIELAGLTPVTKTHVIIRAKLDLRVHRERDDTEMFLDHKTVAEFTTPTATLHLDEQMLMYEWLLQRVMPDAKVSGAIYNMIRKVKRTARAKPPFFERFEIQHSPQEINSFYRRLLGELEEIISVRRRLDAGEDPLSVVYPSPSRDCTWKCDFFPVCHIIDRPQDEPERVLEYLYEPTDPYARYDKEVSA